MDTPPHLLFGILVALLVLGIIMLIPRSTRILGMLLIVGGIGMYIGVSLKKSQWNPWDWDDSASESDESDKPCTATDIMDNRDTSNAATFSRDNDDDCVIATCNSGYFLNGLTCSQNIPIKK
jgi:hypothetical protein